MPDEFIIVYQDCPTCGAHKNWGERTIKSALEAGVPIRKVSFASIEGQKHAMNAIVAGIKTYPFVTDGVRYASNIENLIQAQSEAQKQKKKAKKIKKTAKIVKEQENGADTENN